MKKLLALFTGILVVLTIVAVLMIGCGKQHKTSTGGQARAAICTAMEVLNS